MNKSVSGENPAPSEQAVASCTPLFCPFFLPTSHIPGSLPRHLCSSTLVSCSSEGKDATIALLPWSHCAETLGDLYWLLPKETDHGYSPSGPQDPTQSSPSIARMIVYYGPGMVPRALPVFNLSSNLQNSYEMSYGIMPIIETGRLKHRAGLLPFCVVQGHTGNRGVRIQTQTALFRVQFQNLLVSIKLCF